MKTTRDLENEACALIVSRGGGRRARKALADALRGYRNEGNYKRALWLRKHAYFITGHLWKDYA